jgi:hypothetical protein
MNQDAEGNSLNEFAALRQRLEELEAEHRDLQRQVSRRPFFSRKFALSALAGTLVIAIAAVLWGDEVISIFVDPNGNVGIGTTGPNAKLSVVGTTFLSNGTGDSWFPYSDGNSYVSGTNVIFRSNGNTERMRLTSDGNLNLTGAANFNGASVNIGTGVAADTGTALNVKGAADFTGTLNVSKDSTFKGYVGINTAPFKNQNLLIVPTQGNIPFNVTNPANTVSWLSVGPDGKVAMNGGGLGVTGDVLINGKVSSKGRYQRDDEAETTYEIPPPYHLSLTYKNYAGKSKAIPQDVLDSLCGTPGGCQVRLEMTKWDNDSETESASEGFWFYYSKTDGRWRTNDNGGAAVGVSGTGGIKHARNLYDTCFFTNGSYPGGQNLDKSMKLHISTVGRYHWPNLTCELTITK